MSLQELCWLIGVTRSILIGPGDLWAGSTVSPRLEKRMLRAMRKHQVGLATLIAWSSIDTCPTCDAHRWSWRYDADQRRYICGMCEQLLPEVS